MLKGGACSQHTISTHESRPGRPLQEAITGAGNFSPNFLSAWITASGSLASWLPDLAPYNLPAHLKAGPPRPRGVELRGLASGPPASRPLCPGPHPAPGEDQGPLSITQKLLLHQKQFVPETVLSKGLVFGLKGAY